MWGSGRGSRATESRNGGSALDCGGHAASGNGLRNPFHQARQRPQTAFTIVELVAVVLVLAVLAAAALPRFLDSRQAAHEASVRAVGEAFREAVHLVHARWRLDGGVPGAENLSGFGLGNVDVNGSGWPTDTGGRDFIPPGELGREQCRRLLEALLLGGPTVSTRSRGGLNLRLFPEAYAFAAPRDPTADFYAYAPAVNQCRFEYRPFANLEIRYQCLTGEVIIDDDASG